MIATSIESQNLITGSIEKTELRWYHIHRQLEEVYIVLVVAKSDQKFETDGIKHQEKEAKWKNTEVQIRVGALEDLGISTKNWRRPEDGKFVVVFLDR
ncbi:hypothetical protein L195_g003682 [Trifolium pratense]|uniref:Uncharacterized protein n=1 Tax=Trifolium pratense TaxID=57577 RepID=A0A2K3NVZ6_TRIPR|nr:hypothetical protein L195_g003682 [Trifolium pratense]